MTTRTPLPSRRAFLEDIHGNPGEPEPLLIRWRDVTRIVGKTRSAIYRDIQLGRFPKPVKTSAGGKAVAFHLQDLRDWAAQLPPVEFRDGQRDAAE